VVVTAVLAGCGTAAVRTLKSAARATSPPVVINSGHCPKRQPPGVPDSGDRAAGHHLAPPGIASIVLCRYGPITATGSRLQARRTIRSRVVIDALQRRLDALPAPPAGLINCASDNGAEIWLGLAYATHAEIIESVQLQGCRDVSNGSIVATASGYGEAHNRPPPLKEQLIHLVPLPRRHPAGR
jgi:hypothetical protein